MRQIVIVQMDVAFHALSGLSRTAVVVYIDLVVLQATPEALDDDVVLGTAFAVHADPNLILFQQIDILWTREMAALVTVDNLRLTLRQRPFRGLQYEVDFKALVQLPVYDIARKPIHQGVQVHPAVLHSDIRDVHRPHLIRLCDEQLPEKIGIDPVLQITLAQIWARIDGHEPHFSHVAPYGVLMNAISISVHNRGNLPVA